MKTLIFNGSPRRDGNLNKAYDILPAVISHDTNNRPAVDDMAALAGVNEIKEI